MGATTPVPDNSCFPPAQPLRSMSMVSQNVSAKYFMIPRISRRLGTYAA